LNSVPGTTLFLNCSFSINVCSMVKSHCHKILGHYLCILFLSVSPYSSVPHSFCVTVFTFS
jgi:hypothetical protein